MTVKSIDSIRQDIESAKREYDRDTLLSYLIRQSLFLEKNNDTVGAIEYLQAHHAIYTQEGK